MELQAGRGILTAENPYVLRPITPEEATSTFTTAVESAQAGRQTEWLQSAADLAADIETVKSLPTPASLAQGFAMAAGLVTVSAAAGAAGYPVIATFAGRGAMYTGVSQAALGGMACYQHPTFRTKIKDSMTATSTDM